MWSGHMDFSQFSLKMQWSSSFYIPTTSHDISWKMFWHLWEKIVATSSRGPCYIAVVEQISGPKICNIQWHMQGIFDITDMLYQTVFWIIFEKFWYWTNLCTANRCKIINSENSKVYFTAAYLTDYVFWFHINIIHGIMKIILDMQTHHQRTHILWQAIQARSTIS